MDKEFLRKLRKKWGLKVKQCAEIYNGFDPRNLCSYNDDRGFRKLEAQSLLLRGNKPTFKRIQKVRLHLYSLIIAVLNSKRGFREEDIDVESLKIIGCDLFPTTFSFSLKYYFGNETEIHLSFWELIKALSNDNPKKMGTHTTELTNIKQTDKIKTFRDYILKQYCSNQGIDIELILIIKKAISDPNNPVNNRLRWFIRKGYKRNEKTILRITEIAPKKAKRSNLKEYYSVLEYPSIFINKLENKIGLPNIDSNYLQTFFNSILFQINVEEQFKMTRYFHAKGFSIASDHLDRLECHINDNFENFLNSINEIVADHSQFNKIKQVRKLINPYSIT